MALSSQAANLMTFGSLWFVQYLVLDRVLFGRQSGQLFGECVRAQKHEEQGGQIRSSKRRDAGPGFLGAGVLGAGAGRGIRAGASVAACGRAGPEGLYCRRHG